MLAFLNRTPPRDGVASLEIHADGVALAHVARTEAGVPRLTACEYRGCGDSARLVECVAQAVRDHDLVGARCVCVLSPHQYGLWLVDAPDVEPEELGAAAQWLVKDLIDFPLEEAVVDYFEIPEHVSRGRQNRIYVVAARARAVQRVVDVVEESGLALGAIDIGELAFRNLSALLGEVGQGLALMHLRARGGFVTMTQGADLCVTRGLEVGLEHLLDVPAAENPEDLRFEGGNEMFDALLLELQRSLDYYESQLGQPPVGQLVVTPLERPIPELLSYLEKNLSAGVRRLDLNDLLECALPVSEETQARCLAAVGAALRTEETPV